MRESMGNAMIINIVLVFVGIIIALLIGSLAYSKAFKAKNMIVNVIEKHGAFALESASYVEIKDNLGKMGYRINFNNAKCPNRENMNLVYNGFKNYRYCVYEISTSRGKYYHVVAFMHFDVPLIGNYLEFPLSGETKIIYEEIEG